MSLNISRLHIWLRLCEILEHWNKLSKDEWVEVTTKAWIGSMCEECEDYAERWNGDDLYGSFRVGVTENNNSYMNGKDMLPYCKCVESVVLTWRHN